MVCKFAPDYKNVEGWLVSTNGELVCLDWDVYCTKCRIDDKTDYVFELSIKDQETINEMISIYSKRPTSELEVKDEE